MEQTIYFYPTMDVRRMVEVRSYPTGMNRPPKVKFVDAWTAANIIESLREKGWRIRPNYASFGIVAEKEAK